jgi:hypothetical protein
LGNCCFAAIACGVLREAQTPRLAPLLGCMAWKAGSPADNGGFLQRFYTENGSLFVILSNLRFADSFSAVKKHDFLIIYLVYEHLCVILIIGVLLLRAYRKQETPKDNGAEFFLRRFL